jgi:hypothetical protein
MFQRADGPAKKIFGGVTKNTQKGRTNVLDGAVVIEDKEKFTRKTERGGK